MNLLLKQYAANMSYESDSYPVVYFKSDTTGEKAYEEFYVPGEQINMERYMALGVVEETTRRPMEEVNQFSLILKPFSLMKISPRLRL